MITGIHMTPYISELILVFIGFNRQILIAMKLPAMPSLKIYRLKIKEQILSVNLNLI